MSKPFDFPLTQPEIEAAQVNLGQLLEVSPCGEIARVMHKLDTAIAGEKISTVLLALASKLGMATGETNGARTREAFATLALVIQIGWDRAADATVKH
jgi:hypothetical protein